MIVNNPNMQGAVAEEQTPLMMPVGEKQVQELTRVLQKYKSGKAKTEQRIIASENWWKLRNSAEEQSAFDLMKGKFTSKSGWLHNVIV